MIDGFAFERQFLDHLAPVWSALPAGLRGRLFVDTTLADRATALGLDAEARDAGDLRRLPLPATRRAQGARALVASIGDAKIARRLGYGDFARLEHGAGQAYLNNRTSGSYAGGPDNQDASLVLVPNTYAADRWQRAYPQARVEMIGSPHVETLPGREPGPGPVVAFTWHWPCSVAPETQPALADFASALPLLARRFTLIGHQHPRWQTGRFPGSPRRHYERAGIEFVADFDEVCRRADVLVFDNTSVGFEFAATGRPVVVLNARQYRRSVHHGLRFWEAATVGVQVDPPAGRQARDAADRLTDALQRALELRAEDVTAREDALGLVYAHRSGSAERAAAAIAEWATERAEVAA